METSGEQAIFEARLEQIDAAAGWSESPDPRLVLTEEQAKIYARTMKNVPAAMREAEKTNPKLIGRMRDQQHAVAERNRDAQSNPDLLDQRIH
jgi:hypothetical protein